MEQTICKCSSDLSKTLTRFRSSSFFPLPPTACTAFHLRSSSGKFQWQQESEISASWRERRRGEESRLRASCLLSARCSPSSSFFHRAATSGSMSPDETSSLLAVHERLSCPFLPLTTSNMCVDMHDDDSLPLQRSGNGCETKKKEYVQAVEAGKGRHLIRNQEFGCEQISSRHRLLRRRFIFIRSQETY